MKYLKKKAFRLVTGGIVVVPLLGVGLVGSHQLVAGSNQVSPQAITDFTIEIDEGDIGETLPFNSSQIRKSDGSFNVGATVTFTIDRPTLSNISYTQTIDNDGRIRGQIYGSVLSELGTYNMTAQVSGGSSASDSFIIREKMLLAADDQTVTGRRVTFQNSANDTTAFQVQNAAGDPVLNVDTSNGRVGINTATPLARLQINTGSTTEIGQIIKQAVGQTANYSEYQDSTGTVRAMVDVNGAFIGIRSATNIGVFATKMDGDSILRWIVYPDGQIQWGPGGVSARDTNLYRSAAATLKTDNAFNIQTTSNSATAFRVQNAAGTTLLGIDTTTGKIFSTVADGASAIGFTLNTPAYSTAGAKLISLQNNGTEKFAIDQSGHIITGGTTPSISLVDCGTGATSSITGNDSAGRFTVTTGTAPGACLITVNFATAYATTPFVTFVKETDNGGSFYIDSVSTTSFTITHGTSFASTLDYKFAYHVMQ